MWGFLMAMKFMCMLLGSPFVFFVYELKLEMYEMGMPKGCVVVLYLGCRVQFGVVGGGGGRGRGGGVWYVFGGKSSGL